MRISDAVFIMSVKRCLIESYDSEVRTSNSWVACGDATVALWVLDRDHR